MSDDFQFWIVTTVAVCLGTMLIAYARSRDPFHPGIIISAQLLFLYGFLPYDTVASGIVVGYLTPDQYQRVQSINMLGVLCLSLGLLAHTRREEPKTYLLLLEGTRSQRGALRSAKLFGVVGVLSFAYVILTSGGFGVVYARGYGGGWHDSGYIRELFLMTVPGILWYLIATGSRPLKVRDALWIGVFALPLLIHGILGGRRGPTLVIAFTVLMGYFLAKRRTPSLVLTVLGGAVLGAGVLLLVANRMEIYLGSQMDLKTDPLLVFKAPETNEFIYGGAVILNAEHFDTYNWGGRYLAEVAIRPVPRAIWPSKYQDASEWFGLPDLEVNGGTGVEGFRQSVGWIGGVGAAPGIVADTWAEFWWGFIPFLFLVGWTYSHFWRRARQTGGAWAIGFVIVMALSGYLVTQTFEAMVFRFMFMAVPTWIVWRGVRGGKGIAPSEHPHPGVEPA